MSIMETRNTTLLQFTLEGTRLWLGFRA